MDATLWTASTFIFCCTWLTSRVRTTSGSSATQQTSGLLVKITFSKTGKQLADRVDVIVAEQHLGMVQNRPDDVRSVTK